MSTPWINDLLFDDENEDKLASRQIFPEDLLDVLAGAHVIVRNKRRRRGLLKVIGRDRGGRPLTMVVERTTIKSTWRPVTGWVSTPSEIQRLER